ncbi:hypothetical protein KQH82_07060 [bacterium]|nr:hypothetical protein [bacterium]
MNQPPNIPNQPNLPNQPGPPGTRQVDQMRLEMLMNQIRDNQNLSLAVFGGLVAALVGAIVWAAITYFTGYQIGLIAIGIGFVVGITVRYMGKGVDQSFGIIGGLLSLLGCAFGNLLTGCVLIADQNGMGIMEVISQLTPDMAWQIMVELFSFFDLLMYAFAAYYGYRTSFRQLTQEEIASVSR